MEPGGLRWLGAGALLTAIFVPLVLFWPPAGLILAGVVALVVVGVGKPSHLLTFGLAGALLGSAGAGVRHFAGGDVDTGYSLLRYGVAGLAAVLTLIFIAKVLDRLGREAWLGALVFFAVLSIFWGPVASQSASSVLVWASAIILGGALSAYGDADRAGKLILVTLSIGAGISAALIALPGPLGTIPAMRPGGETIQMPVGLFSWNSELGYVSGVAAVLAFAYWRKEHRSWLLWLALLMFGITVYTDSATSVLAAVVGVAASLWANPRLRGLILFAGSVVAVLSLTGGIAAMQGWVLGLVGRSADLTGRSNIWNIALNLSSEHPLIGYGIGGSPELTRYLGFDAHAHNGYLQLLLELGWIGVGLFAASALALFIRASKLQDPALLGMLGIFLASNVANNFLMTAHVSIVLYAWAAFTAAARKDELPAPLPVKKARTPKKQGLPEWAGRRNTLTRTLERRNH